MRLSQDDLAMILVALEDAADTEDEVLAEDNDEAPNVYEVLLEKLRPEVEPYEDWKGSWRLYFIHKWGD